MSCGALDDFILDLSTRKRTSSFNQSLRTSTPIQPCDIVQIKNMDDKKYSKFIQRLEKPISNPVVRGAKESILDIISGHILMFTPSKPEERDYTYIMVFPDEFNLQEYEAFEDYAYGNQNDQNVHECVNYINLDCAMVNYFTPMPYPAYYYHFYNQMYYNYTHYMHYYNHNNWFIT